MRIKTKTQKGQPGPCARAEEQQAGAIIQIDEGFEELDSWSKHLAKILSLPELTSKLHMTIDLAPAYGVRVWFFQTDVPLGYLVVHYSHYPEEVVIKYDTVLRELECSQHGKVSFDCFQSAAWWVLNLAAKLAMLEQFWDWHRIVDAVEARSTRLGY